MDALGISAYKANEDWYSGHLSTTKVKPQRMAEQKEKELRTLLPLLSGWVSPFHLPPTSYCPWVRVLCDDQLLS